MSQTINIKLVNRLLHKYKISDSDFHLTLLIAIQRKKIFHIKKNY